MENLHNKINKYQYKLKMARDDIKRKFYNQKLQHYNKYMEQKGGQSNNLLELIGTKVGEGKNEIIDMINNIEKYTTDKKNELGVLQKSNTDINKLLEECRQKSTDAEKFIKDIKEKLLNINKNTTDKQTLNIKTDTVPTTINEVIIDSLKKDISNGINVDNEIKMYDPQIRTAVGK